MVINFTLKSPPFSINKAYYKNRQRTQECRKWGDAILLQLQCPSIQAQFKALRDQIKPSDSLFLEITHYIPKDVFYTKKGTISRRSMDLTNVEKLPVDLIYDDRFVGREIEGSVINNLSLDDKLNTTLLSKKRPGNEYSIQIRISIDCF